MTKNKVWDNSVGLMEEAIKVNGEMGNKMEEVFTKTNRILRRVGHGRMVRRLNGNDIGIIDI